MQTVHAGIGLATCQLMIIHVDMTYLDANVALDQSFVSMGVAVVTEDALAAAALPDPEFDFNHDWYYWTRRMHKQNTLDSPPITSWDAIIRSKRRLRGGYRLVLITENPANPDPIEVMISMRNLWVQQA